jgi:23S rRNA (uracil1939-C5)-methyltransferase
MCRAKSCYYGCPVNSLAILSSRIYLTKRHPIRRQAKTYPIGAVQQFEVTGLTHEAKGVARPEGKVTFIDGALPGETVEAQVIKPGKNFDLAKLNTVLTASPHRIAPPCKHYASCGGCSFQHLAGAQQLEAKHHWLGGQLRKVFDIQHIDMLTDLTFAYRRRARLSVKVLKGKVILGFRGKASTQVIAIDNCIVLTEPLQKLYKGLKEQLCENELAAKLGHIELLEDTQGASVLFRLTDTISPALKVFWDNWAQNQHIELYWQSADSRRAQIDVSAMRHYVIDDLTLFYHPQDFIQVNAPMNAKMVAQAMEWLAPNEQDVVLDLFCGGGNFSLPLAKRAKQVIGIEVQESMVAAGRRNAEHNNLSNLSFIAADLSKPAGDKFSQYGVTKILLDPPRGGAFEFLDSLIKIKPQQILYVSCDAATLARDAEYLVLNGFKVTRVTMMDMFPQTSHVETMMLLEHA